MSLVHLQLNPSETTLLLTEAMTFPQLWQGTRNNFPTRFYNAKFVKKYKPRALIIRDDTIVSRFCYLSQPSTEGKAHYGYVQFFPSKDFVKKNGRMQVIKSAFSKDSTRKEIRLYGEQIPFQKLRASDLAGMFCKVSCDCKDFLYRHEVALHSHGASDIKFSNGADPVKTNPGKKPAVCKHILTALNYLVDGETLDVDMDLPPGKKPMPYTPPPKEDVVSHLSSATPPTDAKPPQTPPSDNPSEPELSVPELPPVHDDFLDTSGRLKPSGVGSAGTKAI